jgi:hypothetical protein
MTDQGRLKFKCWNSFFIRLGTIVWTKLDGWPWSWWPDKSRIYIKLFFVCFFGIFNYHLRNSDRLAIFIMLFVLFYLFTFVDNHHKGIVVTHNDCGSVGCHLRENWLLLDILVRRPSSRVRCWPIGQSVKSSLQQSLWKSLGSPAGLNDYKFLLPILDIKRF